MRVVSPAEAWLVTSLLKGVVTSGTGSAVRSSGLPDVVAGKTGTTNDGRDAWFVGYTPRLLALVWVGFDSGEPHGMSGARAALPIWVDFMKQAIDAYPQIGFRGAHRHLVLGHRRHERQARHPRLSRGRSRSVPRRAPSHRCATSTGVSSITS